jgi:hypothetical protein
MAKAKTAEAFDTAPGLKAYALAVQYRSDVEPRLPTGMIATLAADLTLLGADVTTGGAAAAGSTTAAGSTAATGAATTNSAATTATVPSLPDAMTAAVTLITAIHEAILGAKAKIEVRRAYGVSSKELGTEAEAVLTSGGKIVARAQANPTEALGLGILPADVTALAAALADLEAAETAAMGKAAAVKPVPAKDKKAAEGRVTEAVARIAGAGVLAFAKDATVRAAFAGLKG